MMEGEYKTSKFNAAQAEQFRLDGLWQSFHRAVLAGNLIKANWVLDRVWGELVADSLKDEEETFKNLINEFIEIRTKREKIITKREKIYFYLMKKESFIRKTQNRQGKGTAYEDSIEDYMD